MNGMNLMHLFILQSGSISETLGMWGPLVLMVAVFYFFIIRPQSVKQKAQTNFISSMSKGDEVVTASGLIGKITKIDGSQVHLQVDNKTFIRVLRSAISKEMTEALSKKEES